MIVLYFCAVAVFAWTALQMRTSALLPARLRSIATHDLPRLEDSTVTDLSQVLIRLVSAVTAGGNLRSELEQMAGRPFVRSHLTVSDVEEAVSSWCQAAQPRTVHVVSCNIVASARLSEALGCAVSVPLRTVERVYRHAQHVEELRATAFSMPKSTVKLLAALPAVTLAGGGLLGADPLAFLLATSVGRVCLAVGAVFWASGLLWMRILLNSFTAGHVA